MENIDAKALSGRDIIQIDDQNDVQYRGPIEEVTVTETQVTFKLGWVAYLLPNGKAVWLPVLNEPVYVTTQRKVPVKYMEGSLEFISRSVTGDAQYVNRVLPVGDKLAKPAKPVGPSK